MKSGVSARWWAAVGLVWLMAAPPALAVYSCPMPDGKTIFSEVPCDAIVNRHKKMEATSAPSSAQQQAQQFQRPTVTTPPPASVPAPAAAPVAEPEEPAAAEAPAAAPVVESRPVARGDGTGKEPKLMPLGIKLILVLALVVAHHFLRWTWILAFAYAFALSAWHLVYLEPFGIPIGPGPAYGLLAFGIYGSLLKRYAENPKVYWPIFVIGFVVLMIGRTN